MHYISKTNWGTGIIEKKKYIFFCTSVEREKVHPNFQSLIITKCQKLVESTFCIRICQTLLEIGNRYNNQKDLWLPLWLDCQFLTKSDKSWHKTLTLLNPYFVQYSHVIYHWKNVDLNSRCTLIGKFTVLCICTSTYLFGTVYTSLYMYTWCVYYM